jgi:hypothetical protein
METEKEEIYSIRLGGSGTREELANDLIKLAAVLIKNTPDPGNLTDNDIENSKISFELEKH